MIIHGFVFHEKRKVTIFQPVQKGGRLKGKTWKQNLVKGIAKKSVKDNDGKLVVDATVNGNIVERTIPKDRFYSAGQAIESIAEE